MIDVTLIEDHPLTAKGIRGALSQIKGVRLISEAMTGKDGLELLRSKEPDVLLLDFKLPDISGLNVTSNVLKRHPHTKILILTAVQNETIINQLVKAGIHGYLYKGSNANELENAIRKVDSGQRYMPHDFANRLAFSKTLGGEPLNPFDTLTKREMEVLFMLGKGLKNKEIAKELFLSEKTVSQHRTRMFKKVNVKNDIQLIKLAIEYDMIETDSQR